MGGLSAATAAHGPTEEDRFGARVVQDYVDFIRVRPWHEYDFARQLRLLCTETSPWGPDMLRKWERKYALTTEYAAKAAYGWPIGKATRAGYEEALPVTLVVVDRLPPEAEADAPALNVLERVPDGAALLELPRYEAFKTHGAALAPRGVGFVEIVGNRGRILLTVLVPRDWGVETPEAKVLFEQPILTQPERKRVAFAVPVAALAPALTRLAAPGDELERVYDY